MIFVFALACATGAAAQRAPRPEPPSSNERTRYSGIEIGPTPVGAIPDVVIRDNDRNKDVQVTIEYPTRGGPHPLIILSPGFGGTHRGYIGLSSYWTANNYVVIRVNHGDRTANVENAEDIWANATPADWRNRVRDVSFVLDSIESLTKRFPELEGKIDMTKIGVAGHSYGAQTAMLAAGVRTFPGAVSYADPRIKAVIAMSPQGPSESRGLTSESWTELRVPALFMTGTKDQGTTELETPEWRAESFKLSPAGDKWLVTVEGAGHATFGGGPGRSIEQIAREQSDRGPMTIPLPPDPDEPRVPGGGRNPRDTRVSGPPLNVRGGRAENAALRQQEMMGIIRGVALSFFDTYLRADAAGREALEKASTRKGVVVEKK